MSIRKTNQEIVKKVFNNRGLHSITYTEACLEALEVLENELRRQEPKLLIKVGDFVSFKGKDPNMFYKVGQGNRNSKYNEIFVYFIHILGDKYKQECLPINADRVDKVIPEKEFKEGDKIVLFDNYDESHIYYCTVTDPEIQTGRVPCVDSNGKEASANVDFVFEIYRKTEDDE